MSIDFPACTGSYCRLHRVRLPFLKTRCSPCFSCSMATPTPLSQRSAVGSAGPLPGPPGLPGLRGLPSLGTTTRPIQTPPSGLEFVLTLHSVPSDAKWCGGEAGFPVPPVRRPTLLWSPCSKPPPLRHSFCISKKPQPPWLSSLPPASRWWLCAWFRATFLC